jgi:hypothetical protein
MAGGVGKEGGLGTGGGDDVLVREPGICVTMAM